MAFRAFVRTAHRTIRTTIGIPGGAGDVMSPPGRRPKPAHLKLIEGNPGKRPIRAGVVIPPTPVVPAPPPHIDDIAKAEWDRIAPGLHALRLLDRVDTASLAAYCTAFSRWVTAENALAEMAKLDKTTGALMIRTSNGNAVQNPLVGVANRAMRDMIKYAAEFGMTPSARTRIGHEGGNPTGSKFDGLIGGPGSA